MILETTFSSTHALLLFHNWKWLLLGLYVPLIMTGVPISTVMERSGKMMCCGKSWEINLLRKDGEVCKWAMEKGWNLSANISVPCCFWSPEQATELLAYLYYAFSIDRNLRLSLLCSAGFWHKEIPAITYIQMWYVWPLKWYTGEL